jgi:hypothetical protein
MNVQNLIYIRKQKLNKNDMIKIGLIPYEDHIEIFKERAINNVVKQTLENYPKSKVQEIQNPIQTEYNTRQSKKELQKLEKLKKDEQLQNSRMKLRSYQK